MLDALGSDRCQAANGLYHQVLRNEDDAIYTASVRCGQQVPPVDLTAAGGLVAGGHDNGQ